MNNFESIKPKGQIRTITPRRNGVILEILEVGRGDTRIGDYDEMGEPVKTTTDLPPRISFQGNYNADKTIPRDPTDPTGDECF